MSIETTSKVGSAEHNRTVALRWIDAFNARDGPAEAAARTVDYLAHAPDSIQATALDSDAWMEFRGVFVEGFSSNSVCMLSRARGCLRGSSPCQLRGC